MNKEDYKNVRKGTYMGYGCLLVPINIITAIAVILLIFSLLFEH